MVVPGADGRVELEFAVGSYEAAFLDEEALRSPGAPRVAFGPRALFEWTVEGAVPGVVVVGEP